MRAMPSPTSSTWPTSREARPPLNCVISRSRTEVISATFSDDMTAPLDELAAHRLQAGADARVVHPVPHPDDQPAQDVRIDGFVENRLHVGRRPHVVGHLAA